MLSGQGSGRLGRSAASKNAISDRVRADIWVKKMLSSDKRLGELPGAC